MDHLICATVTEEVEMRTEEVEAGDEQSTDVKIILSVKGNPHLYDESDTNFNNKSVTEKSWKEVADGVGLTGKLFYVNSRLMICYSFCVSNDMYYCILHICS